MTAAIASAFRSLNAQLLYKQGVIGKILKVPYLLSVYFFKGWIKRERPAALVTIDNYARDLKIQVDVSKTMGASIYWTGFHEFNEMRFLNRHLKKDMTFVDVGANQGEFALFAARKLSQGKVLAFEPMSLFFDRLTLNVALNNFDNIRCYKTGLSDKACEVPIYFNSDNEFNHEGLASVFAQREADEKAELISLETLDEIVVRDSIETVDFIKVDVEGSEWAVLRGAEQTLVRHKPALMIELNDETASLAGYRVDEMMDWLHQLGYAAHRIVPNGLVPLVDRPAFCNAIFLVSNANH